MRRFRSLILAFAEYALGRQPGTAVHTALRPQLYFCPLVREGGIAGPTVVSGDSPGSPDFTLWLAFGLRPRAPADSVGHGVRRSKE